jgi:uncharacterized coiled-coil DUF342 family protein
MSDDIVTRLRDRVDTTEILMLMQEAAEDIEDLRFQLRGTQEELDGALSRERTLRDEQDDARIGADNLHDEIERLRRNTGCARNQRSTQFCAEALDAQRDVETLRAERDAALAELIFARQTIFQLRTKLAACCRTSPSATTRDGEATFIPEAL